MKCAIMQPTYFPWAGYFNLISKVDYFIFLDDAQFQKSSWHNRNKVLVNNIPTWITIPVVRGHLDQKICDSKIDDTKSWRRQHFNLISQNYSHHDYFEVIHPLIKMIHDTSFTTLSTFNISIIKNICDLLNIKTNFVLSSELDVDGIRTDRIINICHKMNCSHYISPQGAREYLQEDGFSVQSNIELSFNDYNAIQYPQKKRNDFEGHLSILDVLANLGIEKTRAYVTEQNAYAVQI